MPYDVWTGFPTGVGVGQFGTLYDQIVATAALLVEFGSLFRETISMTLLFTSAVFGVLLTIPTYFIEKCLGGRLGGVFAAVVLDLLPGTSAREVSSAPRITTARSRCSSNWRCSRR